MQIISDLHLHSRFSRACSENIDLNNLEKYARIKGINLLGTGDFTHPKWFEEITKELKGEGILWSKGNFPFILTTEISLMYWQEGKGRKVHYLLLAPDKETVLQINETLSKKGRLDYDGRPIFGFSSIELVETMQEISNQIEIIPCHAWTPWFSIFGSNSGFDSVEECFKEKSRFIHALETGMSSDLLMNWRISKLDKYNLVSFSDSHSFWPYRLGREATIFELKELNYKNIIKAIRNQDFLAKNRISSTIETDPSYGKYHFDGHRNCGVVLSPKESLKLKNLCPVCLKPLTLGVAHRVEQLADREEGFIKKNSPSFKRVIPLQELIAGFYKTSSNSKKVWGEYYKLIKEFGNENNILLNIGFEDLKKTVNEKLAALIIKNRNNQIKIKPGYDGVYGEPIFDERIMEKNEKNIKRNQRRLEEF